jgi:hypothetical protein
MFVANEFGEFMFLFDYDYEIAGLSMVNYGFGYLSW